MRLCYNQSMFTNPIKNLRAFGLREDNIIADLGAGTGFYSVAAGRLVPYGKVYAVEIVKDFLATIKEKVKEVRLNNVEILWGDISKNGGTNIGDKVVDAVIVSNILFQVEDKNRFIEEIKRILKPKGRVLLIDWLESPIMGARTIVPKNKAREIFEKKGFVWQRDINTGAYHYGMIFGLGS